LALQRGVGSVAAYLRGGHPCEEGKHGKRKYDSTKSYHFFLLVNCELNRSKLSFNLSLKIEVSKPFSQPSGNFSVSGGERYSESLKWRSGLN
jgi:hypothetical protein